MYPPAPAPASSRLGHSIERKTDDAIIARGRDWHHWLGLGEHPSEPVAEERFSRSFALRSTPINSDRAFLTLTVWRLFALRVEVRVAALR